eukprot:6523851-Prymnesium_polylepis.1
MRREPCKPLRTCANLGRELSRIRRESAQRPGRELSRIRRESMDVGCKFAHTHAKSANAALHVTRCGHDEDAAETWLGEGVRKVWEIVPAQRLRLLRSAECLGLSARMRGRMYVTTAALARRRVPPHGSGEHAQHRTQALATAHAQHIAGQGIRAGLS